MKRRNIRPDGRNRVETPKALRQSLSSETLQVVFAVAIALIFGVAIAIPLIIKAELAFAVIDFLNRH